MEDKNTLAADAIADAKVLEGLVDDIAGTSRIKRQKAAAALAQVAQEHADLLVPYAEDISEGLLRPEAQTRWETLRALDKMGKAGCRYGDDVLAAAEDALYDEANGVVREAAFAFFCGYGSASAENSDEVWPLIDEAIQCYHGNGEFADMLTCLVDFVQSDISLETTRALAQRMRFDSMNASGTLRMRAEQIVQVYLDRGGKLEDIPAPTSAGDS